MTPRSTAPLTPSELDRLREAGHTSLPPDGGALRIVYRASEVIALGNRRYDEGWNAALDAARSGSEGLDVERLARAMFRVFGGTFDNPFRLEDAKAIAAEYARLALEPAEQEDGA